VPGSAPGYKRAAETNSIPGQGADEAGKGSGVKTGKRMLIEHVKKFNTIVFTGGTG
jgi:hypothetical protein